MDAEKNRCLIELRRVKAMVERELQRVDEGKSGKSPFQLLQILKELSAMERAQAKSAFRPYYPRAIADAWDLNDPLGQKLCQLAALYDTVMRG